ncbi:copper amine oxidase N-terminal domain-containing protein [Paenibacillus sp. PR3]|uniref:Copper amine oxidase N-terminal domain-containing protein n=2 Tax=Paenibacillus terricola TaxID=2763503 RepID=A0ABR8MZD9_9BACL|nr:copper amine oxidase N-terminal domain-containing protein [Paenibacillus terricola]
MKKMIPGIALGLMLAFASMPAYAADNPVIKIDGVAIGSDVRPEVKNNRTMVPLRVISENLGAKVNWSNSEATITKDGLKVILKLNTKTAVVNGKTVTLDAAPYVKNSRVVVPLRFIAETFDCEVSYSNSTVTVSTAPLVIDGVQVKALQQEYHMTMGGVVQQISGNTTNKTIYNLFENNKGEKVDAPASYSWRANIDVPGSYAKVGQYDFLDGKEKSLQRYDIYTLVNAFPSDVLDGYPAVLLHDATEDQWYLFSDIPIRSINDQVDRAWVSGLVKIISDTVA